MLKIAKISIFFLGISLLFGVSFAMERRKELPEIKPEIKFVHADPGPMPGISITPLPVPAEGSLSVRLSVRRRRQWECCLVRFFKKLVRRRARNRSRRD